MQASSVDGWQWCTVDGAFFRDQPADSVPLTALLEAVLRLQGAWGRHRHRPNKLHADKAYDYPRCREACTVRGITPRIARRGKDSSTTLGRYRWVVERTFAWLNHARRLAVRYER